MSDAFEIAWTLVKNEEKKRSGNRFKGYSKNRVSGRAERAGKARAWSQSRKVKRGRTRKRYARNKTRGNVRPKLRRQLGAGGERIQVKKTDDNRPTIPSKRRRSEMPSRIPARKILPDGTTVISPDNIGQTARSQYGRLGAAGRTTGPTGEPVRESLYCIRPNCDRKLSDASARKPARLRQCGTCARVHGLKGLEDKRIEHLRLMRERRAGDTGGVDPGDVAPT